MRKILTLLLILTRVYIHSQAVTCPSINAQVATGPSTTICQGNCATLTSTVTPVNQTTTYLVSQIAFAPQPTVGATNVTLTDDSQAGPFPIGFTFCFFGNSYTQFYLGSNGWISFSPGQTTAFTSATIPSGAASVPKNCIMGPWQDWNPGIAGGPYIRYQTLGTAPCRKLVVSWNNCPMYSCTSTYGSFQIVLYETSNIIDNVLINKPNCPSWAGGTAVQGIHNLPGTIGITVPGRNSTQWTATNQTWRYTPNGAPSYTVNWVGPTGPVGTGTQVTVCPISTSIYTANATLGGCVGTTGVSHTVQVVVTPIPTITVNNTTICPGVQTTLTASGATSSTWQPGNIVGSSAIYSPTITTTYTVTGSILGCTSTTTSTITTNSPITASITSGTIACFGGISSNTVIPNGGGPYTYTWNSTPVQNTQIANLQAGNYTVTVNSLGCIATASVSIIQPTQLSATSTQTNVICFSGSNGSANIAPIGGTPGYTYLWSNGQTTQVATNLQAGVYTYTITDSNGCQFTNAVTITQPVQMTSAITMTASTCGLPNGSTSVTPIGGNGPYTYLWSNGQTTQTATNILAGVYSVTITSINGCTATNTINVTNTGAPIVTIPTKTNVSCFGGNNGFANSNVVGGVAPYTYIWSNGQTTPNATNLVAGNYTLTVTGANNCPISTTVNIAQSTQLATAVTTTNVSCFNTNTGSAGVTTSGGTPGYTYLWSNGQTTQVATNLVSSIYSCTITDINGCQVVASANITQPTQLSINISTSTNISCFNGGNGSISVNASGGVGPNYLYSINNGPNQLSPTFNGLTAGNHTMSITDQNGCVSTTTIILTQPTAISATSTSTNVTCNGACNGQLSVTASGGIAPYTYLWSNTSTTNPVNGLCSGTYSVIVTDINGCQFNLTNLNITQPSVLSVSANANLQTICIGQTSNISSSVLGGTSPYTYTWSNGSITPNISISPSITTIYTVDIVDINGCTASTNITVNVNPVLSINSISNPTTICVGEILILSANASGGNGGPYTFAWTPGINGQTISVNPSTTTIYTVTLSDGCSSNVSATTTVVVNASPTISLSASPLAGCVPLVVTYKDLTPNVNCICNVNGITYNNCSIIQTYTTPGNYRAFLTIIDQNGCSTTSSNIIANVYATPVASFSANPISTDILSPNVEFTNMSSTGSYLWDFGDGYTSNIISPTHLYGDTGSFAVILLVTTNYGCSDTTSMLIKINDIFAVYVPNAFTVNGDGKNDEFFPVITGAESYEYWVFDRWGEMMFTGNSGKQIG